VKIDTSKWRIITQRDNFVQLKYIGGKLHWLIPFIREITYEDLLELLTTLEAQEYKPVILSDFVWDGTLILQKIHKKKYCLHECDACKKEGEKR